MVDTTPASGLRASSDFGMIISADCHLGAPPQDLARYMSSADRSIYENYCNSSLEMEAASPFSDDMTAEFSKDAEFRHSASTDSTMRLLQLEQDGVVAEVIFPDGNFTPLGVMSSPDLQAMVERAYNRWAVEFCAKAPERRAGVAVLNFQNIEETVREVYWARDQGLKGVLIPTLPRKGLPLYYHPCYDPIWTACAETGLPVHVHGGTGGPRYGTSVAGVITYLTEMTYWVQRPFWWFTWGGVFDRHPGLRFVVVEADLFWIPGVLKRLNDLFSSPMGADVRRAIKLQPSEYWHRQCFAVSSFSWLTDARFVEEIGSENLMWGSDYPHIEGSWPTSRRMLDDAFGQFGPENTKAIVCDNAARLYNFDLDALSRIMTEA